MKPGEQFTCPACRRTAFAKLEKILDGWAVKGEHLVCSLCGADAGAPDAQKASDSASVSAGREDFGQNLGEWTVSSIYESGWLPDASEHERRGAAHIINHIYKMFRAWLVGYFWIIVLETILYALIFIPFNVPFWPVLSLIAGSTILLPFLGPVLAAILSVIVTVIFAQGGIVMPIIGIALAYLLIHVILE